MNATQDARRTGETGLGAVGWGVAGAMIGLFGFLVYLRAAEPWGLDQGLFACFGKWIPEGALPYRDIWDSKPPATFYTYAAARVLFGPGASAVWTLEALWLLGTGGVMFALGRRLGGPRHGLLAASFCVLGMWAPGWGGYWARGQAEEWLGLFLVAAAAAAWVGRDRSLAAFVCGLLGALATAYKLPAALPALAWPVFWFAASGWKIALRRSGWWLLGSLLPWFAIVGYFGARGALRELFEATIVYNRAYVATVSQGVSWVTTFGDFLAKWPTVAPFTCACALLGVAAVARRRSPVFWFLAPWLLLSLLSVLLQRQLAGYHFLLAVPAVGLAAGLGLGDLLRAVSHERGGRRVSATVLTAVLVILTVWEGSIWSRGYHADWLHRFGGLERARYLTAFRAGTPSAAVVEDLSSRIAEATSPRDGLLVWGFAPGLYALSERRPATRYPFHHVLLTDSPLSRRYRGLEQRRAELMQRLNDDPPTLVLVGEGDSNPFEPLDSKRQLLRFPELRDLVRSRYRLEASVEGFAIFRLQSDLRRIDGTP